jgi:hypothetical protein
MDEVVPVFLFSAFPRPLILLLYKMSYSKQFLNNLIIASSQIIIKIIDTIQSQQDTQIRIHPDNVCNSAIKIIIDKIPTDRYTSINVRT